MRSHIVAAHPTDFHPANGEVLRPTPGGARAVGEPYHAPIFPGRHEKLRTAWTMVYPRSTRILLCNSDPLAKRSVRTLKSWICEYRRQNRQHPA